jgi:hypothetical protein
MSSDFPGWPDLGRAGRALLAEPTLMFRRGADATSARHFSSRGLAILDDDDNALGSVKRIWPSWRASRLVYEVFDLEDSPVMTVTSNHGYVLNNVGVGRFTARWPDGSEVVEFLAKRPRRGYHSCSVRSRGEAIGELSRWKGSDSYEYGLFNSESREIAPITHDYGRWRIEIESRLSGPLRTASLAACLVCRVVFMTAPAGGAPGGG